jgi:hypothetical protein
LIDPGDVPEPGAELDAELARIEQRVRDQLAAVGSAASSDAVVRLSGRDAALLIGCIRELLRDRDALLEEIEALECASAGASAR